MTLSEYPDLGPLTGSMTAAPAGFLPGYYETTLAPEGFALGRVRCPKSSLPPCGSPVVASFLLGCPGDWKQRN